MNPTQIKDLIILVADKNMEFAMRGIFERRQALEMREITCDLYVHPERDPGCLNRGHDFLKPFVGSHAHALVMLDHQGCGREHVPVGKLEEEMEAKLEGQGWLGCAAIVIGPELENWVWSDSPQVDHVLGWSGKNPKLRDWLHDKGYWVSGEPKPCAPKEAVEAAIRLVRKQRSSFLYADLASKVGLDRCTDRSFIKLKSSLRSWFGVKGAGGGEG